MSREPGDLIVLDPAAENEPFGFDWTAWLAEIAAGELIAGSTWAITGKDAGLVKTADSIVTGQRQTQVKLSTPTGGVRYRVTNSIQTSSGVRDDRSFFILGQDT